MKLGIFMLTRNEQRVIVLALLVLLGAAFLRYRHNLKAFPADKSAQPAAMGTPMPMDEDSSADGNDAEDSKPQQTPSPQPSP